MGVFVKLWVVLGGMIEWGLAYVSVSFWECFCMNFDFLSGELARLKSH